jgi:tRNA-dependent cyclodipeptide synthase
MSEVLPIRGVVFVSIGARIMTPDYVDLVLSKASERCCECTVFLLDAPEVTNLIELSGDPEEIARQKVTQYCGELIEHIRQFWSSRAVRVQPLSRYCQSTEFAECKEAVLKTFRSNARFSRHILNQTYRNLQPALNRKGVRTWRNEPMVARLADYLIVELALKLSVIWKGLADVEYGAAPTDMAICRAIYEGRYPTLVPFLRKPMSYVSVRPDLQLDNISYRYPNGTCAISSISLSVPAGSRYGIIGNNGSGKTTLLQVIAGHLRHLGGRLSWGSQDISVVSAGKRPTATVFQDYALFPHMSALANVAFGVRHRRGYSRSKSREIAREWLIKLGLENTSMESRPGNLSGGYQQRVAIARALAVRPAILLLDEPTAALDTDERWRLIHILRSVVQTGWVASLILVSHDRDFALAVCDRIAILENGQVLYEGMLSEALTTPPSTQVACFLGSFNVIPGIVRDDHTFTDEHSEIVVALPADFISGPRRVALLIRPEHLRLTSQVGTAHVTVDATITEVTREGISYRVAAVTPKGTVLSVNSALPPETRGAQPGHTTIVIPLDRILLVRNDLPKPDTERAA